MAEVLIPTLVSQRLILKPLVHQDVEALYNALDDPDVWKYFPLPVPPSLDRTSSYINGQLDHWTTYGLGHWALEDKNHTLLGWCGLQFLPETSETEVAYCLGKPHWGKGYATESAKASLDYALATLEKKEIIGLTHVENKASQNVLKKIGLQFVDRKQYFGMDCFRFRISK